MTLTQLFLGKYRPGMTAEIFEKRRRNMQHRGVQVWDNRRWGTAWHCGPHDYQQLTNGQLKKCSPGVGHKRL